MLIAARGFGRTVGLTLAAADLPAVRPWLPYWWVDADHAPEQVWPVTAQTAETTVSELELWVAEHARRAVFLHAAAVAVDGRALVLPGRSFAGKSTLAAALVRAGADYLSDEYAPLRTDGRVVAYPRPIWLREPTGRRRVPVAELGGRAVPGPLPVAAVALLRYDPAGWAVTDVGAGRAVLGMVDNCVPARSRPVAMLRALGFAAESATVRVQGTRGDADEAARRLLDLLA